MGGVRSGEVVEPFPFSQFILQIDIVFVGKKLVKLFLIRPVRPFDFAIELRRSGFDVNMLDAKILDMPMELGLKLMPSIRPDLLYPERKFLDDMVYKVDGTGLRMSFINLQDPDACCIVDRGILITLDFLAPLSFKDQEFNIHLDMMPRNLLAVALCMNRSFTGLARKAVEAMTFQNPVNGRVGFFDAVVARHVPHDPVGSHMSIYTL